MRLFRRRAPLPPGDNGARRRDPAARIVLLDISSDEYKTIKTRKMKKQIVLFCVVMSLSTIVQAQFSQFHAGLAFPTGKFSDGNERKDELTDGKGFAAMGYKIGFKRYNPLSVENLSWVFCIEAFYHGLNSDYKDEVEDIWKDVTFPVGASGANASQFYAS